MKMNSFRVQLQEILGYAELLDKCSWWVTTVTVGPKKLLTGQQRGNQSRLLSLVPEGQGWRIERALQPPTRMIR